MLKLSNDQRVLIGAICKDSHLGMRFENGLIVSITVNTVITSGVPVGSVFTTEPTPVPYGTAIEVYERSLTDSYSYYSEFISVRTETHEWRKATIIAETMIGSDNYYSMICYNREWFFAPLLKVIDSDITIYNYKGKWGGGIQAVTESETVSAELLVTLPHSMIVGDPRQRSQSNNTTSTKVDAIVTKAMRGERADWSEIYVRDNIKKEVVARLLPESKNYKHAYKRILREMLNVAA